jgi:hypothetical protein
MRLRMVMVVMARMTVMRVMAVVGVMVRRRRVRQRDVCEKNQCGREAGDLTHDSIP